MPKLLWVLPGPGSAEQVDDPERVAALEVCG